MLTTQFPYGPDFPILCVENAFCTAKVSLYGAHILEWTPKGHQNVFFLSPNVVFAHGKAIRGGVPLCWPWFGKNQDDATKAAHGVARTAFWKHAETQEESHCTRLILALPASDPMLPSAAFILEFGEELTMSLMTMDVPQQMKFSAAQHSYFAVSDYEQVAVTGLEECPFTEFAPNPTAHSEDPLVPLGSIDRIYHPVAEEVEMILHDPAWNRSIRILRSGSHSSVVWNPGAELAAAMGDLGAGNERGFLCIESAVVPAEQMSLRYGDTHTMTTRIQVIAID